jgi:hypothetical protein
MAEPTKVKLTRPVRVGNRQYGPGLVNVPDEHLKYVLENGGTLPEDAPEPAPKGSLVTFSNDALLKEVARRKLTPAADLSALSTAEKTQVLDSIEPGGIIAYLQQNRGVQLEVKTEAVNPAAPAGGDPAAAGGPASELPEAFPFRDRLAAAGFVKLEQLKDVDTIEGFTADEMAEVKAETALAGGA